MGATAPCATFTITSMPQKIAVLDYGMGNLHSVSKALQSQCNPGDEIKITDDPDWIYKADRVVFPGQGAARDCMAAIGQHQLNQAIREATTNKPFLGICMGLQVLLGHSEENGGVDLLDLIPGQVQRFAVKGLKVPHLGWNEARPRQSHPLWTDIDPASRFYFVHSYFVVPEDAGLIAAKTSYGQDFASALARDNLFAVQFHPEKSAGAGLQLLKNFLNWRP